MNTQNVNREAPLQNCAANDMQEKVRELEAQLRALGDKPDDENPDGNCARAAIYNGFIKLTGKPSDLDQVILEGFLDCGHHCKATLGDLLRQPDYCGGDFLDFEYCTVYCDANKNDEDEDEDEDEYEQECFPGATYVTGICSGKPVFDTGETHNHCNRCGPFGKCCYDMATSHCEHCDKHFVAGVGNFREYRCKCRG